MRFIACLIGAFFLAVGMHSTFAAEGVEVVGDYKSRTGNMMGIVITTDSKLKAAVIVVDVARLNKPTARVSVVFTGADEWQKFSEIWFKARHATTLPSGTKIGSYFDRRRDTMIGVSADRDLIEFSIAAKPQGELVLGFFDLAPENYEAFDQNMKRITDYFKD